MQNHQPSEGMRVGCNDFEAMPKTKIKKTPSYLRIWSLSLSGTTHHV